MSISIGSHTLKNPSDEEIEYNIDGASYLLASGNVQHDNISGTGKRIITLSWRAISASEKNDIVAAWEDLFSGVLSYTDILSNTYDVTIPESRDKLRVSTVAKGVPVYNVTMKLKEVFS